MDESPEESPFLRRRQVIALLIPVGYGLLLRILYGAAEGPLREVLDIMSGGFLFVLPAVMGALLVYLSGPRMAANWAYRTFAPWVSVFSFLVATIAFSIEGWGCWLIMLPIFLILSSVGGAIGGHLRSWRERRKGRIYITLLPLLPLLISPVEHSIIGPAKKVYSAENSIDIHAPAAVIWANVTRVREISNGEDRGWLTHLLRFPRPLRAELDYEGVGASREAVFTGGLVFHEKVTAYEHGRSMTFSIKAYPHEIPAATMDEHIIIGGKYFDVLTGTYELTPLNDSTCRLHLSSRFAMNTTINWYASLWGRWIMQDIQQNILEIEKQRAETPQSRAR